MSEAASNENEREHLVTHVVRQTVAATNLVEAHRMARAALDKAGTLWWPVVLDTVPTQSLKAYASDRGPTVYVVGDHGPIAELTPASARDKARELERAARAAELVDYRPATHGQAADEAADGDGVHVLRCDGDHSPQQQRFTEFVEVELYRSDVDHAVVVQIDTVVGETGHLRVYVNDGDVFDADPDTGKRPADAPHRREPERDFTVIGFYADGVPIVVGIIPGVHDVLDGSGADPQPWATNVVARSTAEAESLAVAEMDLSNGREG